MGDEILREDRGYICTLSINRPQKRNALNADALFNLGDAFKELKDDDRIRVVVIRGAGDKIFSSGVDLSGGSPEETINGLEHCLNNTIDYPSSIIAMISGPAIGAGLDISVISDFRIASETARFGATLVKLGRIYYYTAIHRLINLIGIAASKELLLTGRLIDSKRALEMGLVNQVLPNDQLTDTTYHLANELAEENAPRAMRATKLTIKRLLNYKQIDPHVESELIALAAQVNQSEDATEGVMAMLEKRKPKFTGK
ncbi:MAG: enoyl-CoA hydratase-related protein [Thermodesulfobacteriota bacterium]|nr:enoyl-CoA hydratase-related protein [Thermodesulfobacteriota bacterium]